jgi:hypothetical protein
MKKTEVQGIYKVSEGVLINKDNDALSKYKKRRDLLKSKDEKIDNLETKVSELSSQMSEIKDLLMKVLTK